MERYFVIASVVALSMTVLLAYWVLTGDATAENTPVNESLGDACLSQDAGCNGWCSNLSLACGQGCDAEFGGECGCEKGDIPSSNVITCGGVPSIL